MNSLQRKTNDKMHSSCPKLTSKPEYFQSHFQQILKDYNKLPAKRLKSLFSKTLLLLKPPIRSQLAKGCSQEDIIEKVCTEMIPLMFFFF